MHLVCRELQPEGLVLGELVLGGGDESAELRGRRHVLPTQAVHPAPLTQGSTWA